MTAVNDRYAKAERLGILTQAVGLALWQLQILEGSTAQFFVLVDQAERGMGEEKGDALVKNAQRKTFGGSLTQLAKTKKLPVTLLARFQVLLKERNWLVHSSRTDSNKALIDDLSFARLQSRLEAITDEAGRLLKEISEQSQTFVISKGIPSEVIEAKTAQILSQWHSALNE